MSNQQHATEPTRGAAEARDALTCGVAKRDATGWPHAANVWLESVTKFDVVAAMTLFVVLVIAHTAPYQILTIAAAVVAFRWRAVRESPWFWLALSSCFVPRLINEWYQNEDHVYMTIYWCVAVGLSRFGSGQEQVLSHNARVLIGLAFAFATFWKIVTPQFYDGSLCSYKLINDFRFRGVIAQPFLGLTDEQASYNSMALVALRETGSTLTEARLAYPDSVIWAGKALAVWTILIEGSLATVFLLPTRIVHAWLRNGVLLVFTLSTYLVVPVLGFGTLFMTMGIAQTEGNERRTRLAFAVTACLILLRFAA